MNTLWNTLIVGRRKEGKKERSAFDHRHPRTFYGLAHRLFEFDYHTNRRYPQSLSTRVPSIHWPTQTEGAVGLLHVRREPGDGSLKGEFTSSRSISSLPLQSFRSWSTYFLFGKYAFRYLPCPLLKPYTFKSACSSLYASSSKTHEPRWQISSEGLVVNIRVGSPIERRGGICFKACVRTMGFEAGWAQATWGEVYAEFERVVYLLSLFEALVTCQKDYLVMLSGC